MTAASPQRNAARDTWMAYMVYALDTWLRRREAVFEYSDDPECVFRIQRGSAEREATLKDGTVVNRGDPVVVLHLWNEQVPAMDASGPKLGWAREVSRKIGSSLRELDAYMAERPEYDDVKVIAADIALGTAESGEQILRLAGRYGFEGVGDAGEQKLRQLGENTLMLLLVLATNPASARLSVLRRQRQPVYLSRAILRRRLRKASAASDSRQRSEP